MKKHKALPGRRDTRITSQYVPADGSIVLGVARGWTGAGEIVYRIEAEKLAGAIEDRKELAIIVNNLGLLVLAQLTGFNLAESLEELPKSLAEWGHIDIKALKAADEQDNIAAALAIAQKTVHAGHGREATPGDGPMDSDCGCRGPGPDQTICAREGCGFCRAAEDMASREGFAGIDRSVAPSVWKDGVGVVHDLIELGLAQADLGETDEGLGAGSSADSGDGPGDAEAPGGATDLPGAGEGTGVAPDELGA